MDRPSATSSYKSPLGHNNRGATRSGTRRGFKFVKNWRLYSDVAGFSISECGRSSAMPSSSAYRDYLYICKSIDCPGQQSGIKWIPKQLSRSAAHRPGSHSLIPPGRPLRIPSRRDQKKDQSREGQKQSSSPAIFE